MENTNNPPDNGRYHDADLSIENREPGIIKGKSRRAAMFQLFVAITACLVFILVIAPMFDRISCIKPLIDFIEKYDIDASALYYTEIEEFSEANIYMENSKDYAPSR